MALQAGDVPLETPHLVVYRILAVTAAVLRYEPCIASRA